MKPCTDNIVGLQQWKVLMCQELLEEENSSNIQCVPKFCVGIFWKKV